MNGSVYSSTDQINLLKNIFTPQFQVGQGGYFQPTVHTYLPGDVEIGDPTTNYNLFLNENALATDLKIAAWSGYPAVSTLSLANNRITGVSNITFYSGGNYLDGSVGIVNNLSGVNTINGFNLSLGSSLTIGTDKVFMGAGAGPVITLSDQVCIGLSAGNGNTGRSLVAIGQGAGSGGTNGLGYVVALGFNSGLNNSGGQGVFIGTSAGVGNLGSNTVFIGNSAGSGNMSSNVVALGFQAAMNNTSSDVIAIGTNAAATNSAAFVVAMGHQAAMSNKGSSVVSLGYNAGYQNSGKNCVFLGSNSTSIINTSCTTDNTFYVYSTIQNTPFLQGDMSANVLGIGMKPTPGFALTVQGAVQNTLTISSVSPSTMTLSLTTTNAATRFFVSNNINLSFPSTAPPTGTHWIVTNTSGTGINTTLVGATVLGLLNVTLPATSGGAGRGITFVYTGTGSNYYAF